MHAPQVWLHVVLQEEYVTQDVSFADLDFHLFVTGETEIICSYHIPDTERQGWLQLLNKMAYLHGAHSWDILRQAYSAIITQIEKQALLWDQWDTAFSPLIQWTLTTQHTTESKTRKPGRTKGDRKNLYYLGTLL